MRLSTHILHSLSAHHLRLIHHRCGTAITGFATGCARVVVCVAACIVYTGRCAAQAPSLTAGVLLQTGGLMVQIIPLFWLHKGMWCHAHVFFVLIATRQEVSDTCKWFCCPCWWSRCACACACARASLMKRDDLGKPRLQQARSTIRYYCNSSVLLAAGSACVRVRVRVHVSVLCLC